MNKILDNIKLLEKEVNEINKEREYIRNLTNKDCTEEEFAIKLNEWIKKADIVNKKIAPIDAEIKKRYDETIGAQDFFSTTKLTEEEEYILECSKAIEDINIKYNITDAEYLLLSEYIK